MHSMHFSFALGAFISPLIAQPFLSHVDRHENGTMTIDKELGPNDKSDIFTLYPIIGCVQLGISLFYLLLSIKSWRQKSRSNPNENNRPELPAIRMTQRHKIMIGLVVIFIISYVGIEFGNFMYLTVFAVKGDLNLSKAEAVQLMALYLGLYALARLVGAFLSIKLTPNHILFLDGALIVVGAVILQLYSQTSLVMLHVGFAIQGFGMGTMLANSLLWLQQYMHVSNKLMSGIVVAGSLGVNLAPIIVGQFIETMPMVLIYLQWTVIVVSFIVIPWAMIIGNKIKKWEESEKNRREQEMTEMIKK